MSAGHMRGVCPCDDCVTWRANSTGGGPRFGAWVAPPPIPSHMFAIGGPQPMTKAALLDKAKEAVADRGLNYGKPEDNFARIARRWSLHMLNAYGVKVEITPASVAVMMADMKIARLENQPNHADSWIDMAGYAACGAEIAVK